MLCLSFLVDACSFLLERAGTVGLFRKPGSLPRIKTLRVRLESFFVGYINVISTGEMAPSGDLRKHWFCSCHLHAISSIS